MAAALPGVIAASTPLPVIGVPIKGGILDGLDAVFSILQMPPGIPGLGSKIEKANKDLDAISDYKFKC